MEVESYNGEDKTRRCSAGRFSQTSPIFAQAHQRLHAAAGLYGHICACVIVSLKEHVNLIIYNESKALYKTMSVLRSSFLNFVAEYV